MSPLPSVANTRAFRMADAHTGAPLTGVAVVYYLTALSGAHAGKFWDSVSGGWVDFLMYATGITAIPLGVGSGNWQASAPDTAWEDGVEYFEWMKDENNIAVPVGRQVRCEDIRGRLSILAAIKAHTDLIFATTALAIKSPVAQTGTLTLDAGFDYLRSLGNEFLFTNPIKNWPRLIGGDCTLVILRESTKTALLTLAGTVLGPRSVAFDVTHDQSTVLAGGSLIYQLSAVFTDGETTHRILLAQGRCVYRP